MAVGGDGTTRHQLPILYGSQTGNAQDVAERIAREGARRHYLTYAISMDMFDAMALPKQRTVLFVASTTGQGDPPDNMKKFWKSLLRKSLPGDWLSGVQFAVFGLGDSGYQKYNAVAKKLERRLLGLGASPVIPKGLGDDQHRSGYEAALDPWLAALWPGLRQKAPLGPGLVDPSPGIENVRVLDPPKFKVTYFRPSAAVGVEQRADSKRSIAGEDARTEAWRSWEECEAARGMVEAAEMKYMESRAGDSVASLLQKGKAGENPKKASHHLLRVIKNERLTAGDHFQDVRHIEMDLGNSGVAYAPGNLLNVIPSQSGNVVDEFLHRCDLDPEALVWVEAAPAVPGSENGMGPLGSKFPLQMDMSNADEACEPGSGRVDDGNRSTVGPEDTSKESHERRAELCSIVDATESGNILHGVAPVRIRALVVSVLDIASSSPRRYFFEVLSHFTRDEREAERLRYFASAEGRDDLYEYSNRERRTVLEVFQDFPSAQVPLEWLLQTVPRLQPRAFSISSSLCYHPNQVHITVAVVNWKTPFNRIRKGLCSNWLAALDPSKGEVYVPIWISEGALRMPALSVPLILVGPGTGCAPFRSFIEERSALLVPDVNQPLSTGDVPVSAISAQAGRPAVGPVFFFFGCRNEKGDFLYREEWERHCSDAGVLCNERGGGFAVAFSRDQSSKVYVQHKIRADRERLWRLLQNGAHIYVAGSASKMPAAVSAAFKDVVAEESGMAKVQATKWIEEMERGGRYHVESWS